MFTGIVTDVGRIKSIGKDAITTFRIGTSYDVANVDIGASIACSGACLTVTEKGRDDDGNWFAVQASEETLRCTNLGSWEVGTPINLERALRVGDELGGHIVSGHVDGVGKILSVNPEGESIRYRFESTADIARFIASKGSITIEGVSLTVNDVEGREFDVNIIPHTKSVTTLGHKKAGDPVNLEVDVLARYTARLNEKESYNA